MAEESGLEVRLGSMEKTLEEIKNELRADRIEVRQHRAELEPRIRKLEDWKLQMQTVILPVGIVVSALLSGLGKWLLELIAK